MVEHARKDKLGTRPMPQAQQPVLHGPTVALIPAYNEERFIGSLVLAVQSYVDEVVVVDDGSRDRTAEIARLAGATVIKQQVNGGKAAAVNSGFQYVRHMQPVAVVMLDGDGQHSADDIPMVLEPVLEGKADLVIGSRFLEVKSDIPAYRQVGQHGLTMITNVASGLRVGDSQSGFRAFSPQALKYISFSQGGFSLESEMQFLAREHKLRVAEVPIKVTYQEPAKRNPVKHGMQVVNGVMQLVGQTRPLLYFGATGLTTAFLGLLLGLHIVTIYRATHNLAVGYGMMTVILFVVGVVMMFSGLILHSMRGLIIELQRGVYERMAGQGSTIWSMSSEPFEDVSLELGK